jgi:hypothetical protein
MKLLDMKELGLVFNVEYCNEPLVHLGLGAKSMYRRINTSYSFYV